MMYRNLSEVMPPLLQALSGERRETALEAAANIMQKVDDGGVNMLLAELSISLKSNAGEMREAAAAMFTCFFKETPTDLVHVLSSALPALVPPALSDPDRSVLKSAVGALSVLTKACNKEDISPYLPQVRELVLGQCRD